jgi:hypothetical protein
MIGTFVECVDRIYDKLLQPPRATAMASEVFAAPRFGRIPTAVQRSGLKRNALYELAGKHAGLLRKAGPATIVDLQLLDQILAELPPARIGSNTSTECEPPASD